MRKQEKKEKNRCLFLGAEIFRLLPHSRTAIDIIRTDHECIDFSKHILASEISSLSFRSPVLDIGSFSYFFPLLTLPHYKIRWLIKEYIFADIK